MKMTFNRFIYIVTIVFTVAFSAAAKDEVDIYELSLDQNLETPKLNKQSGTISAFQYKEAMSLSKLYKDRVELMRNNEVIVITIPASQLFDPNETTLTNLGIMSIKPLLKYLKTKGLYKMLLVMHSDNTGTDKYTVELTRHRVDAVYDWIEANASVDFVVPYALGASDPIMPNNSVDNRRANRRLEVYLVPDAAMVEMAKKGAIRL